MPSDEEVAEFVRKAREIQRIWRERGVDPTLELPNGERVSLLDEGTEELLGMLEEIVQVKRGRNG